MSNTLKIKQVRTLMLKRQLSAYIFPSSDPHQSEYVADHWASRAWISGFTGSAGTAIIAKEEAGLWTDSRYFIQAEEELKDGPFTLYKVYNQTSPKFIDYLLENIEEGATVGCDGRLFSKQMLHSYEKKLNKKGIKLDAAVDLISEVWLDRPSLPITPIFDLKIDYSGESRSSKLKRIRNQMKKSGTSHHLISTLDDIAWTFNLRGSDVNFNPVAYAYALINMERTSIYISEDKVNEALVNTLAQDNIDLKPYEQIWEDLNKLPNEDSILIDEGTLSYSLFRSINCSKKINQTLPSIGFKAIKNEVEIQHVRNAMEKDGVALVHFYRWLEASLDKQPDEFELGEKIAEFRSQLPGYVSESFNAIVGHKGNGAIVHYHAPREGSSKLTKDGLLLIDSGGQYLDGTTDITRTTSLGPASKAEKDAYTRVLKGNIALDMAVFPEGTSGVQLDTLARIYLWHNRMNYLHGTGHGIGFFLNVHEGPQGFYPGVASRSKVSIDEHMITTNEPGYYEAGKFGIRIENCLLTVKAGNGFLKFETLTLFPIATDIIEMSMLTRDEVEWLNNYHKKVYKRLSPHLNEEECAWLKSKCVDI